MLEQDMEDYYNDKHHEPKIKVHVNPDIRNYDAQAQAQVEAQAQLQKQFEAQLEAQRERQRQFEAQLQAQLQKIFELIKLRRGW